MNSIPDVQNEGDQLKVLRARRWTYTLATRVMMAQLGLTLGVSIAGSMLAALRPDMKALIAAASLVVIVVDALILDRYQKLLLKRAAKMGEQFDCAVLNLPWDRFVVGEKLDAEDVHAAAKAFEARRDDAQLKGWYPEAVGRVPLHLARIICQRTNLRYDSRLRRRYGAGLMCAALLLLGVLTLTVLVQSTSMETWVLTLAPATPFLSWAARELYRQTDTADLLDTLKKEAGKLWESALTGGCDAETCRTKSREFQSAIYSRRASSPLIFPLIYKLMRSKLEDEMNAGAEDFVREYERAAL